MSRLQRCPRTALPLPARARLKCRQRRTQKGSSMSDHQPSIDPAQKVLDDFMAAFNARDIPAFEATFNFPSVRFASNTMVILNQGDMKPERFTTGALAEWDHSAWERRAVIHAGADKVHIDTPFTPYCKDGSVLGGFDSIYVITRQDGHWGVKIRSSFAP